MRLRRFLRVCLDPLADPHRASQGVFIVCGATFDVAHIPNATAVPVGDSVQCDDLR